MHNYPRGSFDRQICAITGFFKHPGVIYPTSGLPMINVFADISRGGTANMSSNFDECPASLQITMKVTFDY